MDNGHYHPTEVVSDKISALLTFFPEIALHITRPVRWDSDHVVLFDDETKEICKEIVRCGGTDGRVHIAPDYFDASVNRIAAWVTGFRNVQKALLSALLTPDMTKEQNEGNFTELLVRQEELKTLPFGDVRCGNFSWNRRYRKEYSEKIIKKDRECSVYTQIGLQDCQKNILCNSVCCHWLHAKKQPLLHCIVLTASG